jgi:hypothetical protein
MIFPFGIEYFGFGFPSMNIEPLSSESQIVPPRTRHTSTISSPIERSRALSGTYAEGDEDVGCGLFAAAASFAGSAFELQMLVSDSAARLRVFRLSTAFGRLF